MKTWKSELERLIRERWNVGERFTTTDVYRLEAYFQKRRPNNSHIRASLLKSCNTFATRRLLSSKVLACIVYFPKFRANTCAAVRPAPKVLLSCKTRRVYSCYNGSR
jgi:hypothetical protein